MKVKGETCRVPVEEDGTLNKDVKGEDEGETIAPSMEMSTDRGEIDLSYVNGAEGLKK